MIPGQTYTHVVEIVSYEDETVAKTLHARSEREADLIDAGVNRNLDHDRFFTMVRALDEPIRA